MYVFFQFFISLFSFLLLLWTFIDYYCYFCCCCYLFGSKKTRTEFYPPTRSSTAVTYFNHKIYMYSGFVSFKTYENDLWMLDVGNLLLITHTFSLSLFLCVSVNVTMAKRANLECDMWYWHSFFLDTFKWHLLTTKGYGRRRAGWSHLSLFSFLLDSYL